LDVRVGLCAVLERASALASLVWRVVGGPGRSLVCQAAGPSPLSARVPRASLARGVARRTKRGRLAPPLGGGEFIAPRGRRAGAGALPPRDSGARACILLSVVQDQSDGGPVARPRSRDDGCLERTTPSSPASSGRDVPGSCPVVRGGRNVPRSRRHPASPARAPLRPAVLRGTRPPGDVQASRAGRSGGPRRRTQRPGLRRPPRDLDFLRRTGLAYLVLAALVQRGAHR